MKKIKHTCYFNPSVAFLIEELATERNITFNQALNLYLETKMAEEKRDNEIMAELSIIRESQDAMVEVLDAIFKK